MRIENGEKFSRREILIAKNPKQPCSFVADEVLYKHKEVLSLC